MGACSLARFKTAWPANRAPPPGFVRRDLRSEKIARYSRFWLAQAGFDMPANKSRRDDQPSAAARVVVGTSPFGVGGEGRDRCTDAAVSRVTAPCAPMD